MATGETTRPDGMLTVHISPAGARLFRESVLVELAAYADAGLIGARAAAKERAYLGNLGLYERYGADFYLGTVEGQGVALHAMRLSTGSRKNAWGRYVNHYLAYTRPSRRAEGIGSSVALDVMADARRRGYDRLKTLCQSWPGVLYHEALADTVWGVNDRGELVIDSPLDLDAPFPDGVPIKARQHAQHNRPLDDAETFLELTDLEGIFRRPEAEVRTLLDKRRSRTPRTYEGTRPVAEGQGHRTPTAPDDHARLPGNPPGDMGESAL